MRVPTSTYRLQISEDFDLYAAAELVPYLHDLGVDWVYVSPLLAAEPGSAHGYDVVAHDHVDEARGGAAGLVALATAVHERGMGLLVDIVPNHVGVATPSADPWWWEVLRDGRAADHAGAFDVDWNATGGRIRIPVVGDDDQPGGHGPIAHLAVVDGPDGPELHYFDNRFPVAPGTADDLGEPLEDRPGVVDANTVHDRQHYELVNWRVADEGLNYRRFFAVNSLAGVRVEEPEVFAETHVEIRRWFDAGLVDGLRVDHPDGLRDPKGYLDDLAELSGGAWTLIEKILEPGERLPKGWATAGTTGYDALALVDRVLTDPAGEAPLDALEERLRGGPVDWPELVHDLKRQVADGILHSEVRRIVRELRRHLPLVPAFRAEDAIAELLACFPVYRSYLPDGRQHLEHAFAEARRRRPDLAATYDRIEPWLFDPDVAAAKRFQQTSGMVMAKGVEDCAFYRWSRLTSLAEVGADPSIFSIPLERFHELMAERQDDWPHAMTTLSTHDTKRGEDTRARIHVLSEVPDLWAECLDELLRLAPAPDPGFAALLWQAVVGAWPSSSSQGDWRERLHGYAEKAMREAGDRTAWTDGDPEYEKAVHGLVEAALDDDRVRKVVDRLLGEVVGPGWSNALSAKLLGLTIPGVPDVYQGSELWELSLVDPDNRRPVDFDVRRRLLAEDAPQPVSDSVDDPGTAKLRVVRAALRLRRERPELFESYAAVPVAGEAAEHALAFDRGGAVTVVTRLPVGLARRGGWGDTRIELPAGRWTDVVSRRPVDGGEVRLEGLLDEYPVALLAQEAGT